MHLAYPSQDVEATPDGANVEVTDAMIEAGVAKLFDYDPAFSNERAIVSEIFNAMLAASFRRGRP